MSSTLKHRSAVCCIQKEPWRKGNYNSQTNQKCMQCVDSIWIDSYQWWTLKHSGYEHRTRQRTSFKYQQKKNSNNIIQFGNNWKQKLQYRFHLVNASLNSQCSMINLNCEQWAHTHTLRLRASNRIREWNELWYSVVFFFAARALHSNARISKWFSFRFGA